MLKSQMKCCKIWKGHVHVSRKFITSGDISETADRVVDLYIKKMQNFTYLGSSLMGDFHL